MTSRSKKLFKRFMDQPRFYSDDNIEKLDIDKMLLLNIRAIVNGYDDVLHKIREEILKVTNISVHRAFNEFLLDTELRRFIMCKYKSF